MAQTSSTTPAAGTLPIQPLFTQLSLGIVPSSSDARTAVDTGLSRMPHRPVPANSTSFLTGFCRVAMLSMT